MILFNTMDIRQAQAQITLSCNLILHTGKTFSDIPLSLSHRSYQVRFQERLGCDGEADRPFQRQQIKCAICYKTEFQSAVYRRFSACDGCQLVHWCSQECQQRIPTAHTVQDCTEMRNLRAVERVLIDYAIARKSQKKITLFTQFPRTTYIPLSHIKDWDDYHRRIYPEIDQDLRPLTMEIGSSHPNPATASAALKQVVTDATSIPVTIIAGLEASIPNISDRKELIIHILGASDKETQGLALMDEILHFFPRLKTLRISYVGPEIDQAIIERYSDPNKNTACPSCQPRGLFRSGTFWSSTYHDFVSRNGGARMVKPDLIVAMNTGFSEVDVDSWRQSIEVVLKLGVPALFTAYQREEAFQEHLLLSGRSDVEFLVPFQENKWGGVIPRLNLLQKLVTGNNIGKSYNSQFMYIFRGIDK